MFSIRNFFFKFLEFLTSKFLIFQRKYIKQIMFFKLKTIGYNYKIIFIFIIYVSFFFGMLNILL